MPSLTLEDTVHLIQVALTPVFLLSGIAALLNVYAARLGRVSDRLDLLEQETAGAEPAGREEIARLHRRSTVLDIAVVLGTIGAAATCGAILVLFLQQLSKAAIASLLLFFFGLALVCALASIGFFGLEMLLASRALRIRMHVHLPHLARRPGGIAPEK